MALLCIHVELQRKINNFYIKKVKNNRYKWFKNKITHKKVSKLIACYNKSILWYIESFHL